MTYLRIRKFWDYQNADAWKKAQANKRGPKHPPWCKLYAYRDEELDSLPVATRLVWFELLRLAVVHANAIPNETQRIAKQISMEPGEVANAVAQLLQGAWILETKTPRLSRKILETKPPKRETLEIENPLPPLRVTRKPKCHVCGVLPLGSMEDHLANVHGVREIA